jgi:hypothetical protein
MSEKEEAPASASDDATPDLEMDASFGVERGEVQHLAKKWEVWTEEIEESKRLVIDEIAIVLPSPVPFTGSSPRVPRRRRNRAGQWLIVACPIYYGYVVASLVALAALVVSPVQVYCVGVVLGAMRLHLDLSLVRISSLYAAALVIAAPVMLWVHTRALTLVSRKQLVGCSGVVFCAACAMLPSASGKVSHRVPHRISRSHFGHTPHPTHSFTPTVSFFSHSSHVPHPGQISLLLMWALMQVMGPGKYHTPIFSPHVTPRFSLHITLFISSVDTQESCTPRSRPLSFSGGGSSEVASRRWFRAWARRSECSSCRRFSLSRRASTMAPRTR